MYISISQEISRQYRDEVMHGVATARQAGTARLSRGATPRLARALGWELARYAGLIGKRLAR
jgi:hypothetical protein